MINTTPCSAGTSGLDAQTYRARMVSLFKKAAKKSNDMPQDSENYKRQRVGSATQESQHYSCSSDGVMDVYYRELEKGLTMDGPLVGKEDDKVGCNESGVEASHDQSPLSVQDSSKSPSADSNNPKFAEYWVPVQLTDIQLEQYCSTLLKNTELLCSSKKRNLDLLQDVLGALRKCCDHPYVLDSSLQKFCKERCPLVDYLSLGIQASGKLQLLRKLLPKIREQGLRVLIVYKTTSSSVKHGIGIGDILDDFICQNFGQESYVHIYTQRYVPPKEKQAAVDLFNDRNSGRFVVLTEYSSPPVSIRLTSLNVVILFNSDLLNPITDTRSLQKMSLHTDKGQLRVLRLFSVCTLEEKALCMAHDGLSAPNTRQFISTSTCHRLLNWGAMCQFDRLDTMESNKSLDDEFHCSVLDELSALLSSSCSVISKVKEVGEGNIELHGELQVQSLDDVAPHVVWSSLLQGRIPCWRYLPNEAGSMKKRSSFWDRPPEMSEGLLHEEMPSWHQYAKRSKRVPRCILGFQEKLLEIKRLWYSDISENIMKVDRPHRKRRLEKKNVEKELLITELCGESYRKLGRFKLDDEILLMNPEIDAPSSSTSIESRNLITSESAIGTLEEQPVEKMNGENGNNLPTEISDRFVLEEDLDIFAECLPIDEMIVVIGSDSDNIYVRPKTVPVAEFSDPIPVDNLIVCDSASSLSESELKADKDQNLLVTENQSPINGIQSSEELVIQSDTVEDITDALYEKMLHDNEQITVQNSIDQIHQSPSEQLPPTALPSSDIRVNDESAPQNAVSDQGLINGMQSSEELAIQSDTVEDISDTLYKETLHGNEQITLQQSIDQTHQLPSEQLPPTPLPCSDIRVTDESAPSSSSCEIVENEAGSQPIKSPSAGSMRPNTSGPLDSFLMQSENQLMMHPNDDPHSHQTTSLDPLQVELEKIQNTGILETKKHEDMVLQLKAARDKEIEQTRQKYGLLYQNVQKDFTQKKQELQICYEKTKAHKALADAWKLVIDENIPISLPPSLVQQTNIQLPYETVLPPYPSSYQNLCNPGAGYGAYTPNLYLYSSFPDQTSHLHRYPLSQQNQYPLNLNPSTLSTATAYPQLYSPVEYLAYYNILI